MSQPVLAVRDLVVSVGAGIDARRAVDGLDLHIEPGEIVGLVGRSGSGKSLTARAVLGLLPEGVQVRGGEMTLRGTDLRRAGEAALQRIRGGRIAFIPQDGATGLDPTTRIGHQVGEALRIHRGASRREAWAAAVDLLARVGIVDPERRARDFPETFSGGMQQRALVAAAMAVPTELIIADEPTSALDPASTNAVLSLIRAAREANGTAVLLISHDLALMAQTADRIVVVDRGKDVENGPAEAVLNDPRHPATQLLLAAVLPAAGRK